MTKKLVAVLPQFFFILGLVSVVYGVWLYSHASAFIFGGLLVASIAFFIGYTGMAQERGR